MERPDQRRGLRRQACGPVRPARRAFTPTCSTSHLPRYEALYEALYEDFRAEGIDDIVCLSVNDAFVMYQWGKVSERHEHFPAARRQW